MTRNTPRKETKSIGNLGEDIACIYLEQRGFEIIERNYRRKWGELDIIARKNSTLHFVEVKAVTSSQGHHPAENVDGRKMMHINRMIQTYIVDKAIDPNMEIAIDVLCIYLNLKTRRAQIDWIKDIVL